MKKLLTQTLVLAIALAFAATTFAQSPTTASRQRRTASDATAKTPVDAKASADPAAVPVVVANQNSDISTDKPGDKSKDKSKPAAEGEKPTIWIEGREENGKSLLVIRDNGEGIEPQNLDKIFDPFFTTKDVGQGMGLGLSICYRIVQEYEGRILVRSEWGKFCEFTLEFPVKG